MEPISERKARHVYLWPPEHIALLGTMSDEDVAKAIGGKKETVCAKRNALKIKAFKSKVGLTKGRPRPNFLWTEDKLNLLGTMPDRQLAVQLGLANTTIARKRRSLGIAGQKSKLLPVVIPQEFVQKLGALSDQTIAAELGVSGSVISRIRTRLGIKPIIVSNFLPTEANSLLGKTTDAAIAAKYGVSHTCVRERRIALGIAKFINIQPIPSELIESLGKVSDTLLAKKHNISVERVRNARSRLGIDAAPKVSSAASIVHEDGMLGKETDYSIAKRLGISTNKVRRQRISLGIETYNKNTTDC